MSNVLVFSTSVDETIKKLFAEIGEERKIDCLIQSSRLERFRREFPKVNFIDIKNEAFYDLPADVMREITGKKYGELYITLTGDTGYRYGNIMQIVAKVKSDYACFYNWQGEKIRIPPKNFFRDLFWRMFIKFTEWRYRRREQ